MEHADVIIVGAGHAGAQAAIALRQNGFEGSVILIGREREAPYERPPLSKEYLAGEKSFERLYIRPDQFWQDKQIDMRLGVNVAEIDPLAHTVTLGDESQLSYKKLIWATGGDARRLSCPGADCSDVFTVRHRSDVERLKTALGGDLRKAAVIGGGYIGLEAAAILRKLGHEVTVLEAMPRLLARVAGPEISEFFEEVHRSKGVDVRLGTSVTAIENDGGRITGVATDDGEEIPADMVVVGIGIVPSVGPLIAAGATGSNGVDVDEYCRTILDDVYAVGDCAAHASEWAEGAVVRIESVQNANDMATTAAKAICGDKQPYRAFPWFWSNQHDIKLQTAGLSHGHDATVLRGDPDSGKFSVIYLKDGRITAIDCVNNTKDYVQGRKLIEKGADVDITHLADIEVPLKELL